MSGYGASRFDAPAEDMNHNMNDNTNPLARWIGATAAALVLTLAMAEPAAADENLLGYVKGAEPLPRGAWELYQWLTSRSGKGAGRYVALDAKTEFEYGVTDRFSVAANLKLQSIETSGLMIDGYLPADEKYGLRFSGIEGSVKYNFLSPAREKFGLSTYVSLIYDRLDAHSGQDKKKYSVEAQLLAQKYFLDGELVWVGNLGTEATHATRGAIASLPPDFEWTTDPEIEWEWRLGSGASYRFAPNWYAGLELVYETEFETEVGQERWSLFAGPSLHYGSERWWATLTWTPQIKGGGERYPGQIDTDLHLIEKTEREVRLKFGLNF
jgi:Family of unknown function (DUF6662)